MPRCVVFRVAMTLAVGAALSYPVQPSASKDKVDLSPGGAGASPARRAWILAGHGEWDLAWQTLRAEDDGTAGDLAVALLTRLKRAADAESLLANRIEAEDNPSESFFRQVQRARLLLESGDAEGALDWLAPIDSLDDPDYGAYRDVVLADARVECGDAAGALRALDRAAGAVTTPALRTTIDEARIDALLELGRPHDARVAADESADAARAADARAHMLRRSFDIALGMNDDDAATRAATQLFDEHRRSAEARTCADEFLSRGLATRAPTVALMSCAGALQGQGRGAELKRALRVLDGRKLSAADAEALRLLWGEYHYLTGDYSRAIALSRPSYENAELRRRSTLLLARSFRRVGRAADAARVYEAYAAGFPDDSIAAEALYTAASLYADAGEPAESNRVEDNLRRSYPSSFYGWAAAMRRASDLAEGGEPEQAAAIYEQSLSRSRRTDEAALFYLSRARAQSGSPSDRALLLDELAAVNPYSFYVRPDVAAWMGPAVGSAGDARRSELSEWLVRTETRRESAYRRVFATAAASTRTPQSARSAFDRARRFLRAGFDDWAQGELDAAMREGAGGAADALRAARVFDENAMPWRSVRLYERARVAMSWEDRREHVDDFRYLMYPIPYPAHVLEASQSNAVAPYLLYGLMREESRFEADAVSRAGAIGLMQLMPETAGRVAAQMDLPWEGAEQLESPGVNVAIGAWYAADLLREGGGSVAWMLAAYNAGPGAATRWIPHGTAGDEAVDAVESIDYRETRGYVKRVVESANVYHDLYFGGGGLTAGSTRQ